MSSDKDWEDKSLEDTLREQWGEDLPTKEEWEQKLSDEEEMKHRAVKPKKRKKKDRKKFYEARGGGMIGSNKIIKGYKKGGQV
jgi:hypothetical protein